MSCKKIISTLAFDLRTLHSPLCIPFPPPGTIPAPGESTKSMGLDLRLFEEPVADELLFPDVPALPPPPTLLLITRGGGGPGDLLEEGW